MIGSEAQAPARLFQRLGLVPFLVNRGWTLAWLPDQAASGLGAMYERLEPGTFKE